MTRSRMLKYLLAGVVIAGISGVSGAQTITPPSGNAAGPAAVNASHPDVARIEDYLNAITTMDSRFIQVAAAGLAEGRIRLSRPRDMRIEYDPPVPILMVASGRLLMYHDSDLKQTSFLPVNQTPAAFFLRDEINLGDGLEITGFEADASTLRLSLVESANPDSGSITLVFEDAPLRLVKWQVVDPQGTAVEVVLLDPSFGAEIDNDLFDLIDPNLQNP